MDFKRIAREGFIAGLIGATAVAAWFFIVDLVAGRAFFTPAMLGQALFFGLHDPQEVQIAFPTVVAYTMVHAVGFAVVGMIAALLAFEVELFPSTLFVVVVFFAVFEFGFYVIVATMAQPLLGSLAWANVAIGNAIAAVGMGYYLWQAHPGIKKELKAHPLGEPLD
ncbi:MAG: hypothetical protein ACE5HT_07560 [Gemmatimonadales bacterium]